MTETKRFLIDDAGELIDLKNHKFIDYGDECCKLLNELSDENEQLKQFKDKVFKVIDEKIIECEKAVEEIRLGDEDSYIVKHDVASKILKELKNELSE